MGKTNDFINSISAKENENGKVVTNRFNKNTFNELLLTMANDIEFKEELAKKAGDSFKVNEVLVTKDFRKWVKKLVESFGVDSKESQIILTEDYGIKSMDGLYDFFMAAVYEYMVAGNRFEFPTHEDFKASITIKEVDETVKNTDARNPNTGEYLGTYETKSKKHKVLSTKSKCPTWLSEKRRIK